jgi:hypothetical protein
MIVSNLHKCHSWVLQTGEKLVLHCWAIDCCNCKHKLKDFLHSERVSEEGDRFGLHLVFEPVHDRFINPFSAGVGGLCTGEACSYKLQATNNT